MDNSYNNERIREYLKLVVENNSEEGELKPHSIPRLVFLWIIVLFIGSFVSIAIPSTLTFGGSIVAVLALSFGTGLYSKKKYNWFLFRAYNAFGVFSCALTLFLGFSMGFGMRYLMLVIVFAGIMVVAAGIISYRWKASKIKKGWNANQKNRREITIPIIVIASSMCLLFLRLLPEKVSLLMVTTAVGVIGAAYIVAMVTTYHYGKKYDPHEIILKNSKK